MRDDERDMKERHERQDGIINRYTFSMGLGLALVVYWIINMVAAHLASG